MMLKSNMKMNLTTISNSLKKKKRRQKLKPPIKQRKRRLKMLRKKRKKKITKLKTQRLSLALNSQDLDTFNLPKQL